MPEAMMFPCKEIEQMPDLFMYLTYDNKHICYKRFKAKDLIDANCDDDFFKLKKDAAVGVVENEYEAGYVRVRLYFNRLGIEPELSVGNWDTDLPNVNPKKWTLATNVYQCRGLPSGDKDATSDPFVTVYCNGKEWKTEVKEDTCNPI